MVIRREADKESKNQKDIENSSDSDEDLEFLIDGLLGSLSLDNTRSQNMTIKKRKDISKHERSDRNIDIETAVPQAGVIKRKVIKKAKNKVRKSSTISSGHIDRNWQSHRENQPSRHNRSNDSHDEMVEVASGNNSEDEYFRPENSQLDDHGLEQLLKEKKGWKVVHVRGDGACLFRSIGKKRFLLPYAFCSSSGVW